MSYDHSHMPFYHLKNKLKLKLKLNIRVQVYYNIASYICSLIYADYFY